MKRFMDEKIDGWMDETMIDGLDRWMNETMTDE